MTLDFFQCLTIINTIILAILPLAFFRRQKLQEIKYKELMELNVKTHDITKRADKSVNKKAILNTNDYDRLDYLISRYRKHSVKLSERINEYKLCWEQTIEDNKKGKIGEKKVVAIQKELLLKSEGIRELADKLLK